MCVATVWFTRHWRAAAGVALAAFGPLAVTGNLIVQQLGFNPIFLVSDPAQKWKLLTIFLASLMPFLAGAVFLGSVFLKNNKTFGRVYFADLAGSGLCGLVVLGCMYLFTPANLIAAPLAFWLLAAVSWSMLPGGRGWLPVYGVLGILAFGAHFCRCAPMLRAQDAFAVNDYKGVAYARKLPESKRVYESTSPFGYLEAYTSSYLHFAPGLSDNAGFNLKTMPANAYLGLYIDSDGPIGVMRDLKPDEREYFRYLPMYYPYIIKQAPKTFIVQFGGGISTEVALSTGRERRDGRRRQSCRARGLPRPGVQGLHQRHSLKGPRHRLRGPAFPRQHQRKIRRHRLEPGRQRRALQPRRLRRGREVPVHPRSDAHLHERARGRRRAVGDDVEQGRTAESRC